MFLSFVLLLCTTQDDICCSEIILFPNYFITVVYYYRTYPILYLYFFSVPTFFIFQSLVYVGISNYIQVPLLI